MEEFDNKKLEIFKISESIKNCMRHGFSIRDTIGNYIYRFDIDNFSVQFIPKLANASSITIKDNEISSDISPRKELFHLTFHTLSHANIPVQLVRSTYVINNESIVEYYDFGEKNMYDMPINEKIKGIIVRDFTSTNREYSPNDFEIDKFERDNIKTTDNVKNPFILLDREKVPENSNSGFYLTSLDDAYMKNHSLVYRQYLKNSSNNEFVKYEDYIKYSNDCINECKKYYALILEAYKKVLDDNKKTI